MWSKKGPKKWSKIDDKIGEKAGEKNSRNNNRKSARKNYGKNSQIVQNIIDKSGRKNIWKSTRKLSKNGKEQNGGRGGEETVNKTDENVVQKINGKLDVKWPSPYWDWGLKKKKRKTNLIRLN